MQIVRLFTLSVVFGAANSCYLDTLSGPVEGILSYVHGNHVKVFLGIPFAEPPVGNLRFKKPQPVKPWKNILEATRMPPACMQYTEYPFPWADDLPGKSEDCLYLNIYAPIDAEVGSNLPLLFWIYGGSFLYGSNRLNVYDARALAVYGNVIVVTINYRLGLFGFLTSNTEDAPGNVGMYDVVTALQWVNDNIELLGGDKKRITLVGESAGAMIISLLCISPLTKGLFSKAILQSGTSIFLNSNHLKPNIDLSQRLAEAVGCVSAAKTIENDAESVVGCLRSKNADDLARVLSSFNPSAVSFFFPQYGDDLFPNNIVNELRDGNFHNVPLLIGNVNDEGSFLVTTTQPDVFGFFGQKNPAINKTQAENMIRNAFSSFEDPEKYVQHYLNNTPDDDYDAIKRQTYTAYGDYLILCDTVYFAEIYADKKNDVYYYLFSHRPSNTVWSSWMGTVHTEENQFVFGRPIRKPYLYEPAEVALSQKMVEIWSNFAKKGVPSDSFHWPKYSRENHTFVRLDTDFKANRYENGPHLESCNIMREHFGL